MPFIFLNILLGYFVFISQFRLSICCCRYSMYYRMQLYTFYSQCTCNVQMPCTLLQIHNMLHGDAKGWAKRIWSFLLRFIPGVMNPHARVVQKWNKFFVIACSFAVFLDPLFFFLLYVQEVSFLKLIVLLSILVLFH